MCSLRDFVTVLSFTTPFKVTIDDGRTVLYGRCYKGADRDNTFKVFSVGELLDMYGDYAVIFSHIIENILYIDIDKKE